MFDRETQRQQERHVKTRESELLAIWLSAQDTTKKFHRKGDDPMTEHVLQIRCQTGTIVLVAFPPDGPPFKVEWSIIANYCP
ncbi:hypothetical protein AUI46_05065 [archaeon 13_1_40CM_2_52_13]|nr:MAG: hypothetical protein AUI46_05065 [archaeon 13_1_40CM_2_52_13]